jgi:hypothetical protein
VNDVSEAAVPDLVQVRVAWTAIEAAQPLHVNQALGQLGPPGADGVPDGIYLTMGVIPPPALISTDPEAQARLLEQIRAEGVKVNIVGQFHMTRQMLTDLITLLQTTADKYDAAVGQQHEAARTGGQQR